MDTPDVRVRLSAEGVAEVVAALKKVQVESEKAAAKQSRGFLGLNRILGSTAALLDTLGVALGVHKFRRWIDASVDAADQVEKLGQKVGASTENLSALHLVARTSASSLEDMGAALARQNKFLGPGGRGEPPGDRRAARPRPHAQGLPGEGRGPGLRPPRPADHRPPLPRPAHQGRDGHLRALRREPHPDHERPGRGGPGPRDRPGPGAGGPDRHAAGRPRPGR